MTKETALHMAHIMAEARIARAIVEEDNKTIEKLCYAEEAYKLIQDAEEYLKSK